MVCIRMPQSEAMASPITPMCDEEVEIGMEAAAVMTVLAAMGVTFAGGVESACVDGLRRPEAKRSGKEREVVQQR